MKYDKYSRSCENVKYIIYFTTLTNWLFHSEAYNIGLSSTTLFAQNPYRNIDRRRTIRALYMIGSPIGSEAA